MHGDHWNMRWLAEACHQSQASTTMDTTCPNCGKHLRLKPEWAGRTARCKSCNSRFVVPTVPSPESRQDAAPPNAFSIDPESANNGGCDGSDIPAGAENPFAFLSSSSAQSGGAEEAEKQADQRFTIESLRRATQSFNPMNPRLPYWQRGGVLSIFVFLPIIICLSISRSADKPLGEAIVAWLIAIPACILICASWLLLCGSKNLLFKLVGYAFTPFVVPVVGAALILCGFSFAPGAVVGFLIGLTKPQVIVVPEHPTTPKGTPDNMRSAMVPQANRKPMNGVALLAAVGTFILTAIILPIVGFQLTGVQILNSDVLRWLVLGGAFAIAGSVYAGISQRRKRSTVRPGERDDCGVTDFLQGLENDREVP